VLLGHHVLSLARVWLHREKVEREAADQFARLSGDLRDAGAPGTLIGMSEKAATDEAEHAILCRRVVDRLAPGLAPLEPALGASLGPAGLTLERRALYASVALSCVTETFSAALLLEMRRLATDDLVRDTVQRILRDEIDHSRLGWGYLAWVAGREDVSWLSAYLPGMIHDAVGSDLPPASLTGASSHPGEGRGVLAGDRIQDIAGRVLAQVIAPGLARYGIHAGQGRTKARSGAAA
jgi:hypothetical protein